MLLQPVTMYQFIKTYELLIIQEISNTEHYNFKNVQLDTNQVHAKTKIQATKFHSTDQKTKCAISEKIMTLQFPKQM